MKFSYVTLNEPDQGQRPAPAELLELMGAALAVPLVEILRAQNGVLRLRVDYGSTTGVQDDDATDRLGSTKFGIDEEVIRFLVTVFWPASMPQYKAEASLLHEIMIHVAPRWAVFRSGQTPSDDIPASEKAEHRNPDLWAAAVTAARTGDLDKGVIQETVRDAVYRMRRADDGTARAEKFRLLCGMPDEIFDACLDGKFAGGTATTTVPVTK